MPAAGACLLDLLACPDCRAPLRRGAAVLCCEGCGAEHPFEAGIPRLLPRHERTLRIEHESALEVRSSFPPCVQGMIDALARDQVVLDLGAGERDTDDPRVLRFDLRIAPRVDVVADAHCLPLRPASVDVVIASAVFEHLQDPFAAAAEIHRVLKPGGQVLADCSFVFPFHGYPASYFHASYAGLRRIFAAFREIAVEVPPWNMPSYSLEVVLQEWLHRCRPRTDHDRAFLDAVRALGRFQVRELDRCFDQADALRLAAGTAFLGLKQDRDTDSTLPPPAMARWAADPALQARYPRPAVLLPTLLQDHADSFLRWTRGEGAGDPELQAWHAARPGFRKTLA